MRRTAVFGVVFTWFVSLGGCPSAPDTTLQTNPSPGTPAAHDAAHDGPPSAAVAPSPDHADARRATVPCRAIAVDGDVRSDTDAGASLAPESGIAPEGWVALGPSARLVVKDPRSTRETTFRGPARVRACVDGLEESWVSAGAFESTVGAGESPGAEEWVVTPLGVVRFAAARLAVQVSSRRRARAAAAPARSSERAPARDSVRLIVTDGVAFVWAARDAMEHGADGGVAASADEEGWLRVAGATFTLTSGALRTPLEAARSAVQVCAAIGQSAHDLASALLGGDGRGDGAVGPTAVRQVTTRRLARAACGVAALRVEGIPSTEGAAADARATLEGSLRAAFALWRGLPHPP
jgi:hypothetical protein